MKGVILAFIIVLFACGRDQHAGGVDANTNYLEGQISFAGEDGDAYFDSIPIYLVGVQESARKPSSQIAAQVEVLLDSTFTDSSGNYHFEIINDGVYKVEAFLGDSLLYTNTIEYVASKGAVLEPVSVAIPYVDKILFDDFNNGDAFTGLYPWYADALSWSPYFVDEIRVAITPSTAKSGIDQAIEDCDVNNPCLHFASDVLDSGETTDVSAFYSMLRPYEKGCIELPNSIGLNLNAKGAGNLYLAVWMENPTSAGSYKIFPKTIALQSTWQNLSVSILELLGTDSLQYSCVHKFVFGIEGSGELWLDDITLEGVSLFDFYLSTKCNTCFKFDILFLKLVIVRIETTLC